MGMALDDPYAEPAAEALVLLPAHPLPPPVVRDLPLRDPEHLRPVHGDLVRLHLRRPVDVRVPPVPQGLPRPPLPDVGELVDHIEVENPRLPGLQVLEPR